MKFFRKQILIATSMVLILSLVTTTSVVFAGPPTSKTLRSNLHWVQGNNDQGKKVSAFSPQSFKVAEGTEIELVISHKDPVSAETHVIRLTDPDGLTVDEITLNPGESESITFTADKLGTYKFSCRTFGCQIHRYMSSFFLFNTNGEINVN